MTLLFPSVHKNAQAGLSGWRNAVGPMYCVAPRQCFFLSK